METDKFGIKETGMLVLAVHALYDHVSLHFS